MNELVLDADVIVVGAGPTGSLTALELARAGARVTVIEAEPVTTDVPKAGTIHARSIQLLTRRGYFHPPDPSARAQSTVFHYAGQVGLRIDTPAGEGPAIAGIGQSDLERAWRTQLSRMGVPIVHPALVTEVVDAGDHVEVAIDAGRGDTTMRAHWVVGADGARSIVRRSGGFTATEHPPTAGALLGLAVLDDPYNAPAGWVRTDRGWTVINPNPTGLSRIITFDMNGPHADHRSSLTARELQRMVDKIAGRPVPFRNATALSRFSDYARVADSYRLGRLLLVGDAAHVHFPLGGQGLNLGLADAVALGWRLSHVVAGTADAAVLDDFSRERRPAAMDVVRNVADQREHMRNNELGSLLRSDLRRRFEEGQANSDLGRQISGQDSPPAASLTSCERGQFASNRMLTTSDGLTSLVHILAQNSGLVVLHHRRDDAGARYIAGHSGIHAVCVGDTVPMVVLRPDGVVVWTSTSQALDDAARCVDAALGRGEYEPSRTPGHRSNQKPATVR